MAVLFKLISIKVLTSSWLLVEVIFRQVGNVCSGVWNTEDQMSWHGNIKAEKLHEQNLKSMSGGFFVQADQYQGSSLHIATNIF